MALTKVMVILTQNSYRFVRVEHKTWKIVPHPFVFELIRVLFECEKVVLLGFIYRHVKQIGLKGDTIILIPRVKIIGKKVKQLTHVLLPEFILPYCRYTVKSLASVSTEEIEIDYAKLFTQKEWDRLLELPVDYKSTFNYLTFRKPFLVKRYNQLVSKVILRVATPVFTLFKPFHFFHRFFFCTEGKDRFLSPLGLLNYIVCQCDTG